MSEEKQMDSVKLSILIPTMESRKDMFEKLLKELDTQIMGGMVDVDADATPELSIGEKRNNLLQRARGEYVCFVDDDDEVSKDYVYDIMEALMQSPDCLSLRGVITWDGVNPELFEHSIRYKAWITNTTSPIKYERYPNHLNVIKASIAKQFKFPDNSFGEDHDWAKQIHESGLLKNEVYIDKVLYNYKYVTKK